MLSFTVLLFRQDFNGILTVMLHEDTSSDSSSSDDDDLDFLLVDAMFPPTVTLEFPRLNLHDLSDMQCKTMFRYALISLVLKKLCFCMVIESQ